MIRLMHAADLHLDSPFAALAPEQAAQRREEQRQLVRRLAEECVRRNCQLLLLAGDLFDSDLVYKETAELLCEVLGSIRTRVFIAPGNHDPWSPVSPYATLPWPENVHIFRSREPEAVHLEDPSVTVWGAAFTGPHAGSLLQGFRVEPTYQPQIMVIHGVLGDPDSPYNPISEEELQDSGLDYLALGHIHKSDLQIIGKTTAVNPGCAMGRGFDETGPKGAIYAELDEDGCRVTQVPLGGRAYETLRVNVQGDALAAIEAELPEQTESDIYRITLTGTCPPPDLYALRQALAGRFFGLELRDETLPPQELWQATEEDSLKGEFLRQLKACYDGDEDEEARRIVVGAVRIGLALMEGREVPEL